MWGNIAQLNFRVRQKLKKSFQQQSQPMKDAEAEYKTEKREGLPSRFLQSV